MAECAGCHRADGKHWPKCWVAATLVKRKLPVEFSNQIEYLPPNLPPVPQTSTKGNGSKQVEDQPPKQGAHPAIRLAQAPGRSHEESRPRRSSRPQANSERRRAEQLHPSNQEETLTQGKQKQARPRPQFSKGTTRMVFVGISLLILMVVGGLLAKPIINQFTSTSPAPTTLSSVHVPCGQTKLLVYKDLRITIIDKCSSDSHSASFKGNATVTRTSPDGAQQDTYSVSGGYTLTATAYDNGGTDTGDDFVLTPTIP